MNTFVVLAALFGVAVARPGQLVSVTQDTLGNYNVKYDIEGISRVENGDIHGNVEGGFSYIDPHGILRKTEFTSGVHGYNAVGSDIPLPPLDTPEVAHAKAAHLATLHAAYLAAPPQPLEIAAPEYLKVAEIPLIKPTPIALAAPAIAPLPTFVHSGAIPETPEVLAARAEHFAAHAAARSAHYLY